MRCFITNLKCTHNLNTLVFHFNWNGYGHTYNILYEGFAILYSIQQECRMYFVLQEKYISDFITN